MEVPHLRDQNGRRRCYVLSKSVARFVSLILYFLPLLKVCCQTSLLALAPACIVTGLHHVVMERRDDDGSGGNILLTGCNRTSGQVVVVVVFYHIYWQCSLSAWKSVVAQEKISPSFQVIAGLLTWWLGGVGVEGETPLFQKVLRGLTIAFSCSISNSPKKVQED